MRKSCRDIVSKLDTIMNEDTNNLIAVSSGDRQMMMLAGELNKRLREIRKQQLNFLNGDNQLKDAVTNISHDLRTPLTAIMGYLEMMKDMPKSKKLEEYLEIIMGRATAMKQLTDELFSYSVILSSGSMELESMQINKLLEDCVMGFYGAFAQNGIDVKVDITDKKIMRKVDAQALSRVFSNLMNNALKYSGGDLSITLKEPCEITFSNTAQELTQTQVEKLFDRFYTVESARKSTGLGLSIARTLVDRMGGTIDAALADGVLTITIVL
ncbi:MAG: HAMP domain-containing histidine kinase [Ruminococcus sp.]|nr:HAMP domain-containing histidine kinase [Ruminococcus sp.]